MKRIISALTLLSMMFLLTGCGGDGPWMKKDSKNFKNYTSKFVGDWKIVSYQSVVGTELIGSLIDPSAKMNVNFETGKVKITLPLTQKAISEQLADWRKWTPHKDINVSSYTLEHNAGWQIASTHRGEPSVVYGPGETRLKLIDSEESIFVKGSGIPDMGEFEAKEESKIPMINAASGAARGAVSDAAFNAGSGMFGGGLGGFLAGAVAGKVVGDAASNAAKDVVKDTIGNVDHIRPLMNPTGTGTFKIISDKKIQIGGYRDGEPFMILEKM